MSFDWRGKRILEENGKDLLPWNRRRLAGTLEGRAHLFVEVLLTADEHQVP
jgi:hypothetical protein